MLNEELASWEWRNIDAVVGINNAVDSGVDRVVESSCGSDWKQVHYAKSYRPFELFVNENYKL